MIEQKSRPAVNGMLSRMLGFELALGVIALVLAWLFGVSLAAAFAGPWLQAVTYGVLATVPLLLMMVWFDVSQASWVVALRTFVEQKLVPLFDGIGAAGIFLIALFAGVFEELLFRGVIQNGLDGAIGLWPALMLTSLLFGLAHAMTWSYFFLTAVMGLYLGGLYAWTDQLLVPILAHFLYDWAALTWLLRKPVGPATEPS